MIIDIPIRIILQVVVYVQSLNYMPLTYTPQTSLPFIPGQPESAMSPLDTDDSSFYTSLENSLRDYSNAILCGMMAVQGMEHYRQEYLNDPISYTHVYKTKLSKLEAAYKNMNSAEQKTELYTSSYESSLPPAAGYTFPITIQ